MIQLGDWLNLGYGESEHEFFDATRGWVDEHLIGNHEYPLVAPRPYMVEFSGFSNRDRVAADMFLESFNERPWKVASSVGNWLITHAGLHPKYAHEYRISGFAVDAQALFLNRAFERYLDGHDQYRHLFDDISHRRGGRAEYGGVLWGDWKDLSEIYDAPQWADSDPGDLIYINQIVGHTPRPGGIPELHESGKLWNIDIGAKHSHLNNVACVYTDDNGRTWTPYATSEEFEEDYINSLHNSIS